MPKKTLFTVLSGNRGMTEPKTTSDLIIRDGDDNYLQMRGYRINLDKISKIRKLYHKYIIVFDIGSEKVIYKYESPEDYQRISLYLKNKIY